MAQSWLLNEPKAAVEHFRNKLEFTTGPVEVYEALRRGQAFVLVDVRRKEDFDRGHIPGAVNLPEDEWSMVGVLKQELLTVVYGYSFVSHLGTRAAFEFAKAGFPVREMDGGFKAWQECGYETTAGAELSAEVKSEARADVRPEPSGDTRPTIDDFTAARMTSHH